MPEFKGRAEDPLNQAPCADAHRRQYAGRGTRGGSRADPRPVSVGLVDYGWDGRSMLSIKDLSCACHTTLRSGPAPTDAASGRRPSLLACSASVALSCVRSIMLAGERFLHFQLNRNKRTTHPKEKWLQCTRNDDRGRNCGKPWKISARTCRETSPAAVSAARGSFGQCHGSALWRATNATAPTSAGCLERRIS